MIGLGIAAGSLPNEKSSQPDAWAAGIMGNIKLLGGVLSPREDAFSRKESRMKRGKRLLLAATLAGVLAVPAMPVLAAQGQITEVNPSGVGVANSVSDVGTVLANTPAGTVLGATLTTDTGASGT